MSDYNNKYVLNKTKMTPAQKGTIYELNNMDVHDLCKLYDIVKVFNMTGDNTDNESLLKYIDAIIERLGDEMYMDGKFVPVKTVNGDTGHEAYEHCEEIEPDTSTIMQEKKENK